MTADRKNLTSLQIALSCPMETWSDTVMLEVEIGMYGDVWQRLSFRNIAQEVIVDGKSVYDILSEKRELPENKHKLVKDWAR